MCVRVCVFVNVLFNGIWTLICEDDGKENIGFVLFIVVHLVCFQFILLKFVAMSFVYYSCTVAESPSSIFRSLSTPSSLLNRICSTVSYKSIESPFTHQICKTNKIGIKPLFCLGVPRGCLVRSIYGVWMKSLLHSFLVNFFGEQIEFAASFRCCMCFLRQIFEDKRKLLVEKCKLLPRIPYQIPDGYLAHDCYLKLS